MLLALLHYVASCRGMTVTGGALLGVGVLWLFSFLRTGWLTSPKVGVFIGMALAAGAAMLLYTGGGWCSDGGGACPQGMGGSGYTCGAGEGQPCGYLRGSCQTGRSRLFGCSCQCR